MPKSDSYPTCFDPYLRYAISTRFRDFEFFDEEHFKLFFLVEFKPTAPGTRTDPATQFEKEMEAAGVTPIQFDRPNGTLYRTLRTTTSAVFKQSARPIWDKYFSRVELSLPLLPTPHPLKFRKPIRPKSTGKVLIGVLDDGCPFAAAQF